MDSTSQQQPCIEDLTVLTRHCSPEPAAQQSCKVPMAGIAVAGHQAAITPPPSTSQIFPMLSESCSTNSRPAILSTSDNDNQDTNMQMVLYQHLDASLDRMVRVIQMGDQVRKLSVLGNENPGHTDKVVEESSVTHELTPIRSPENVASISERTVSNAIGTPLPAVESLTEAHQQAGLQLRTENLPRLALLDLPLLGIAPPSQELNAPPQTLERMHGSPMKACPTRSPVEQDLEQTTRHIHGPPVEHVPHQGSSKETAILQDVAANSKPPQVDDGLDDEVTFIISVPRRRKRKRRAELSTSKTTTSLVEKSNLSTDFDTASSLTPRCLTATSATTQNSVENPKKRCVKGCVTRNALPTATDSTLSTARTASHITEQASGATVQDSLLEISPSSNRVTEAASNVEKPLAVADKTGEAISEVTQTLTPELKRKGGNVDGQALELPPMKRVKTQVDQVSTPAAVVLSNHHARRGMPQLPSGCAAPLKSPDATSVPAISNQHRTACGGQPKQNEVSQAGGSTLPVSEQQRPTNQQVSLMARHLPTNSDLQDMRRKPSLYSIPSWPSSSNSPNSTGSPQSIITNTNTSQVTQTGSSYPSAPKTPTSQNVHLQRSNPSHATPPTSQNPYSSPVRTVAPTTQPNATSRSLENHNRPTQPLSSQHGTSSWPSPSQQFLTVEQRMQQDRLRSQSQQLTFTPQEYARYLHLQQVKARQQQQNTQLSPRMRQPESPLSSLAPNAIKPPTDQSQPIASLTLSTSPSTSPSPNLLVDIAQTCQAIFPFALIAERHKQPVKKIFDAFSAVIQIPLLQAAADGRRNGKLGTARLKKFREAVKAVGEDHERERRAEREGEKLRAELVDEPVVVKRGKGRPPKNAGVGGGKGLLGMALANSQKNAGGSK